MEFGYPLLFFDALQLANYEDIFIDKPDQDINVGGTVKAIPWGYPRNSGGNSFYSGVGQKNMGTKPICWSYGQNGGGQSANDVCIGIRTDNGSLNSPGRAVLGILGTVGPVTPLGPTSQESIFLSAEASLQETVNLVALASASEGWVVRETKVNDSSEVARIDVNGYKLPSFTFEKLPPAPNGYVVFCIDCNQTCTSGGGKGRTCFRENGAWTH